MKFTDSILPAGKKWKLVWNDEFDGMELDPAKWDFRRHKLQQKFEPYCGAEGLSFPGDSCVHLKRIRKANGEFYSCQLQTGYNYLDKPGYKFYENAGKKDVPQFCWPVANVQKPKFVHKFGYYEIRCKLQKTPGWHSAFWLQSPRIGCSLDPWKSGVEVDVMECFDAKTVSCCNHWNGYGSFHESVGSTPFVPEETDDGFHLFGLEWTPNCYVYYMDGRMVWSSSEPVSRTEQFILVTTECEGYGSTGHADPKLLKAGDDEFVVDFVRVYDEVEQKHSRRNDAK